MVQGDLVGTTIGGYEIRSRLGAGGMGTVYRAYQPALEREVAFKVLSLMLADVDEHVKRFFREARTSASLEHAHIVPIYDFGMQEGINYVVMRLLTGGNLAEWREKRAGRLPSPVAVGRLLGQLGGALDYAHSNGVIHRDIKDKNIMFDEQGVPFLVDFGIAKLMEAETTLTATGTIVGTPSHIAPEIWSGLGVFPATDQYALAIVAFDLLTGQLPFEGDNPLDYMRQHLKQAPPSPRLLRPELPEAIVPVLLRALAKDPDDRFPSVLDFARAFAAATLGRGSAQPRLRQGEAAGVPGPRTQGPRRSLGTITQAEYPAPAAAAPAPVIQVPTGTRAEPRPATQGRPSADTQRKEANLLVRAGAGAIRVVFSAIFKLVLAFMLFLFVLGVTFNFFGAADQDIGQALSLTLDPLTDLLP